MEPLFKRLQDQSVLHLLKDNLIIPSGADEYIRLLSLINNSETIFNNEITKHLQPNAQQDQIVTAYSNFLKSDELPADLGQAFYMQSLAKDELGVEKWNWDKLVNEIKNLIKVSGSNRSDQIDAAIKMMLVLCFKFKMKSAIQLSNDKNFKHGLFFMINNQKDESLLALLILCSVLFNPDNQKSINDNNVNGGLNTFNNIISKPDEKKLLREDLLNYLIEFQLFEDFLEVQYGNNNLQTLSKFIIQNYFEVEKARELINADTVFKFFDDFYQAVDQESLSAHIKDLYKREENLIDRIKERFDTVPISYQLHYYFAKVCPDEFKEPYFEFLAEGFRNLEKEEWLKHLAEGNELIELAILIQKSGFDLKLSVKLKDALEEHYKKVYSGKIDPPSENIITQWDSLLNALDEDIKSTFLKNIKFYIESNTDGMVANIGYLYDSILIPEEIYLSETDRFISNVFTRVLKSNNEIELTWLKELIQQQPEILEQDKSATKVFKTEVEDLDMKDYSDKSSNIVEEIATILEVDRSENNKED